MALSNKEIIKINKLTTNFYNLTCDSFSETRSNAWVGWESVNRFINNNNNESSVSFVDIGCGNMRFEKYMAVNNPQYKFKFYCIDNCPELSSQNLQYSNTQINFNEADIIQNLIDDIPLLNYVDNDYCVSFGVLHHIPTSALQKKFVEACLDSVKPGGFAILSFWQFQKDNRILNKAIKSTSKACSKFDFAGLNDNDYFLQWKERDDVFRFCHAFTDDEIQKICSFQSSKIIQSFNEDGKNHNLNKYIILKRTH